MRNGDTFFRLFGLGFWLGFLLILGDCVGWRGVVILRHENQQYFKHGKITKNDAYAFSFVCGFRHVVDIVL